MNHRRICHALIVMTTVLSGPSISPLTLADDPIEKEMSEPFCYFLVPSDVLGFKDCPEGTQVTHDGAFNTGFGEFDLHAGWPPTPVNKRVKTLLNGYLPVIEYTFDRDGATYTVQAFATPLDLDPTSNLINFIRVTVANRGASAARAAVRAVFTEPHGQARHPLSCQEWYRDKFMNFAAFTQSLAPRLEEGRAWRAEHLVFTYPPEDLGDEHVRDAANRQDPQVDYEFELAPGQSQTLVFKVPYVPVHDRHRDHIAAITAADYNDTLNKTITFWENLLSSAVGIELPDDKTVNTMKAGLIYDLIARDVTADGKHFIQKVNEFQYDNFYPRDSAYIIRTYDLLGLHGIAEETLEHFLQYDDNGQLTGLQRLMPDDWGQSLWSIGAHFRSTGDMAFAERVYPAIPRHVALFETSCASDPLGLWPAAGPYDNEAITGHYTGHSFWALLGLREAVNLATALEQTEDAERFRKIHDNYRERFMARLRSVTSQTDGYIPPGLEDPAAGCDWANASGGVYPFGVLQPHDPLVSATVRTVREYKYREGIMTYGPNAWAVKQKMQRSGHADPGWLHHYETFYVAQTLLARGEQRQVLEDFYSILAHTGSTHSGFEFTIRPWSDRDPKHNRPPHGWFAARYNEMLRNMLIREEGQDLHLASALAPGWLQPGKKVRVSHAATFFGTLSYNIQTHADGADIKIEAEWRTPPNQLVFHVPWYLDVTYASVDGEEASVAGDVIQFEPSAQQLELRWRWKEEPDLSYQTAVRSLLDKYHRRPPRADYSFLFPTPRPPRTTYGHGLFIDDMQTELFIPGGRGTIRYTLDGSPAGPDSKEYIQPLRMTDTTTINAVTVWDDGRTSEPMQRTLRKVTPHEAPPPPNVTCGLAFSYYEGAWGRLPEFAALTPVHQGTADRFDLTEVSHREDDFAVKFDGFIKIPRDGVYTFYIASDDGSRLSIGPTIVMDNDGLHSMKEEAGDIALRAGVHPITVTFFERGGAQRLKVSYAGPDIPRQKLPPAILFRN